MSASYAVVIPAPVPVTYTLSYGTGGQGDPWNEMTPFRDLRQALAWFRHLERTNPIDAYRLEDSTGRLVMMVVPGTRGDA